MKWSVPKNASKNPMSRIGHNTVAHHRKKLLQYKLANNMTLSEIDIKEKLICLFVIGFHHFKFTWQGSTIGIRRVCTYGYFYWRTHNFGHGYVDTYAHFFSIFSFQNLVCSYNFILLTNLIDWPLIYFLCP